ncbi:MAG TPA: pentapeptide repeat-containing protein, partial [Steroidobacteraceae bacterium]
MSRLIARTCVIASILAIGASFAEQLTREDIERRLADGARDFTYLAAPGADLSRLDFSGARLFGAELQRANLTDAKLVGCNLNVAILRDARLIRADLRGAQMSSSVFA